jgi:hypothetical protein
VSFVRSPLASTFIIGPYVALATRGKIEMMVTSIGDVFYEISSAKTVLGFEFYIDTGGSQPSAAGLVTDLTNPRSFWNSSKCYFHNGLTFGNAGFPWSSSAPKPPPEDVYRRFRLTYVRLSHRRPQQRPPLRVPYPRCEDAIDDFGDSLWQNSSLSASTLAAGTIKLPCATATRTSSPSSRPTT